ncbi:heterokaryon incompatibility protein-domain-containing protein [Phaeosphaeria sp. MPI-PUGE-AT-0046c]|nr:heterokaryon incompatibility protein-domain-containing protein [Phaeosphaeria sp. MPI-PUGE-AT-0046c]
MPSTFKHLSLRHNLGALLRKSRHGSSPGAIDETDIACTNESTSRPVISGPIIETRTMSEPAGLGAEAYLDTPFFKHTALNHDTQSMRLVRIHPDLSSGGQIQCDIKQTTVDTTYMCLSYVWGDQDHGEFILIDGKSHWVGHNLLCFLKYARRKSHLLNWLWIDALCINQSNLAERTHQVQYMGHIYSGAEQIISWLGPNKDIASFLTSLSRWEEVPDSSKTLRAFCACEYWNRAWITQEVALARRLTLMARKVEVPVDEELNSYFVAAFGHIADIEGSILTVQDLFDLLLAPVKSPVPMLTLLRLFQHKRCAIPRDRIFSLLALCPEGPRITVDYEATDEELSVRILKICARSLCMHDAYTMVKCLEITDSRLLAWQGSEQWMVQFDLPVQERSETWIKEMTAYRSETKNSIEDKLTLWRHREEYLCTRIIDSSGGHIYTVIEINSNGMCASFSAEITIVSYPNSSQFIFAFERHNKYYHKPRPTGTFTRQNGLKLSFSRDTDTCCATLSLPFVVEMARNIQRLGPDIEPCYAYPLPMTRARIL